MTKRIEWIDCLKAFLIFLVVYGHLNEVTGAARLIFLMIYSFHMPAFFFLSGICTNNMGWGGYIKTLSKFTQLFFPTVVVGLIGIYTRTGCSLERFLYADNIRDGYWFTITLFEIYVFYAIVKATLDKFNASVLWQTIVFSLLIIARFAISAGMFKYSLWVTQPLVSNVIGLTQFFVYILWFLLGAIAKIHFSYFEKLIKNNVLMSVSFLVYVLVFVYGERIKFPTDSIMAVSAILILFRVFLMSENFFSSNNKFGKILVYVGQRTLPIYLVHYFFIEGMRNLSLGFRELVQQNWFFELIIVSAIGIMICGACLAVEKVLQKFPLLHSLAFGFKLKKK